MTTIDELTAGATDRRPIRTSDARSGAEFEMLNIDGHRRFLKVLDAESDWIMRVTGNTDHWEHKVWQAGLYHRFPERDRSHDHRDGAGHHRWLDSPRDPHERRW